MRDTTLTEVCDYLNNHFVHSKASGNYAIVGKTITLPQIKDGQYFRIIGSVFNDGVHKYPATDLVDEEFKGAIWGMAVPQTVIALCSDIEAWQAAFGGATSPSNSPYQSESFQNYSYTKASGSDATDGADKSTWQGAFASRLNKYRRLRGLAE